MFGVSDLGPSFGCDKEFTTLWAAFDQALASCRKLKLLPLQTRNFSLYSFQDNRL